MSETNYLKEYIGQPHVATYHNRLLTAVAAERNIPFHALAYTGFAGLGKTHFAKLFSEKLGEVSGNEFQFSELSSGVTLPGFMQHWANHVAGRRAVVLIDEAHDLKNPKVVNLLKRILETEKSVKEVTHEQYTVEANPFNQLFIFATNEEPRDSALFGPTSRTKSLQFLPYSRAESLAIMKDKAAKWNIDLTDAGAEYLVDRVVPNGRAISELIENDALVFGGKITIEVAKKIVAETGRYPLGLRVADIKTLMFVGKDEKGKQVQEIAAAAGGEDKRTTSYRLQWLAGMNLLRTAANGRKVLAQAGLDYLAKLKKAQDRAARG